MIFSLAVLLLPTFPLAVRSPVLHVALEMTAGWVALTAAVLLSGRLRRRGELPDLLLVLAFGISGLTNLVLSAGGSLAGGESGDALAMWGALAGRTLTALLFVAAAYAPARMLPPRRWGRWALVGCASLTALAGLVVSLAVELLPGGVGLDVAAEVGTLQGIPPIRVHPLVDGAQLVMGVAYGAAVFGFVRRSERTKDPMVAWLTAAAVTAMLSRVHFFLFPSLYSGVVYSGDFLRMAFHVLLLGAVLAELQETWRALARGAAAEERRRIARDLHDGLAQELAFVTTQATWLARHHPDEPRAGLLASAAQRALDESRYAIETLAAVDLGGLPEAVTRAVEDVAGRYQQEVHIDIDEAIDVSPDVREQLVRIVREAVANAVRHGAPNMVTVRLRGEDVLVLEIEDDGDGFDPEEVGADRLRFGLRSMRERTESLGGSLSITSAPGKGSTVRAEVPWTT